MTIKARIDLLSVNRQTGDELVTMVLRYPRFIHSEFMTYRMFSRNAASSRAIPAKKMRESVMVDPAIPVEWGKNCKGMSAIEHLDPKTAKDAEVLWLKARDNAVRIHEELEAIGTHKQILNRIIEPWLHIDVVVTANFQSINHMYIERSHSTAQPEFRELVTCINMATLDAMSNGAWQEVKPGDWHLPLLTAEERQDLPAMSITLKDLYRKISVTRCARVSYNNHETIKTLDEDLDLYARLAQREAGDDTPKHLSPLEHVAMCKPGRYANFQGFQSLRNMKEV